MAGKTVTYRPTKRAVSYQPSWQAQQQARQRWTPVVNQTGTSTGGRPNTPQQTPSLTQVYQALNRAMAALNRPGAGSGQGPKLWTSPYAIPPANTSPGQAPKLWTSPYALPTPQGAAGPQAQTGQSQAQTWLQQYNQRAKTNAQSGTWLAQYQNWYRRPMQMVSGAANQSAAGTLANRNRRSGQEGGLISGPVDTWNALNWLASGAGEAGAGAGAGAGGGGGGGWGAGGGGGGGSIADIPQWLYGLLSWRYR